MKKQADCSVCNDSKIDPMGDVECIRCPELNPTICTLPENEDGLRFLHISPAMYAESGKLSFSVDSDVRLTSAEFPVEKVPNDKKPFPGAPLTHFQKNPRGSVKYLVDVLYWDFDRDFQLKREGDTLQAWESGVVADMGELT